jgi:hypothetical protein
MNEKEFRSFINSDLVNFMEQFQLEEIQVKDSRGNKAKIKKDGNGVLNVETTVSEIM